MIITPLFVVFIVIVFVLLFLFLKTVDKRNWLVAIISLGLTPVVYFFFFYPFLNIISSYHHQKYFNSEAWLEEPSLRYEMINAIEKSDTLIDLNKTTVENLLGKAEWLSWDDIKKQHDSNRWNYNLGMKPGAFNNNKECVEVIFKNDKAISINRYKESIEYNDAENE